MWSTLQDSGPLRADEAISVFVCSGLGTINRLGRQFFTLAMFTTIPLTITCINVGELVALQVERLCIILSRCMLKRVTVCSGLGTMRQIYVYVSI